MKKLHSQQGWTSFGVIGVIISAVIGTFGFEILLQLVPSNVSIVVPWAIVSLFVIPFTLCVQLILKLWDLKELDDISREERRRLKSIIDGKTRQFFIAIIYYVSSAVIVVTLYVFLANDVELFRMAIKVTGILLSISMFSIYLILLEMKELSDFKAKLIEREISKKRQKLALKRLNVE
jgi:MFS family permease